MARFTAVILLERSWSFDFAELAEILAERFDVLGEIRAEVPEGSGPPILTIDGAPLPIEIEHSRWEGELEPDGLGTWRSWDLGPALADHRAHILVSCATPGSGFTWAKAVATVVTLIAGALARLGPALAVVYPSAGTVLPVDDAYRAGRMATAGVSPIEAWVGFMPVRPENGPEGCHGALSRGLRIFIGREVEVAPAPMEPRRAIDRAHGAAWQALDGDDPLAEGATIGGPLASVGLRIRAAPDWLRPGVPAFVLLSPDAVVDPETLTLLPPRTDPAEHLAPVTDGLAAAGAKLRAGLDQASEKAGPIAAQALEGAAVAAARVRRDAVPVLRVAGRHLGRGLIQGAVVLRRGAAQAAAATSRGISALSRRSSPRQPGE